MTKKKPTVMPDITFIDDDYNGVVDGHDDPIVISAAIINAKVKHVLVDLESSTNILFRDAFDKLGL